MGGLAVVFFIGLYIAIAYWAFKRFDGSNFRWLVVALAVLPETPVCRGRWTQSILGGGACGGVYG